MQTHLKYTTTMVSIHRFLFSVEFPYTNSKYESFPRRISPPSVACRGVWNYLPVVYFSFLWYILGLRLNIYRVTTLSSDRRIIRFPSRRVFSPWNIFFHTFSLSTFQVCRLLVILAVGLHVCCRCRCKPCFSMSRISNTK